MILAVIINNGGTGKTTSAVNLADALSMKGEVDPIDWTGERGSRSVLSAPYLGLIPD